MASNSFGQLFKITTWGESHGKAIGVLIDGCPAGVEIDEAMINEALALRAPGHHEFTSQRKEADQAEILSGVFEGKTTGTPISLIIWNKDVQSAHYERTKNLLRPGHANYTYLHKYQNFDYRGGGRASARETACRVAAGAIAKKILSDHGVLIVGFIRSIGNIRGEFTLSDIAENLFDFSKKVKESPFYCPHGETGRKMEELLLKISEEKDSIGGLVEAMAFNVPVGWGDPVYEKLEANLAKAMLSLPASKGFSIGSGYDSIRMKGSEHNDLFSCEEGEIRLSSNYAGGTLGGISNGMPILISIPFKPASSIGKEQETVSFEGEAKTLAYETSRHDPCVAIRAVPVVEAMCALVLVDAMLMNNTIKYKNQKV